MPRKDSEKAKAYSKKYAKEHAEEKRRKTREWVKNNPSKKKDWDLRQLGWTYSEYESVRLAQNDVCAICKKPEEKRGLSADHEHVDPPKKRGLLCRACNMGLGQFNDNPELLELAAIYLRKYGKQ